MASSRSKAWLQIEHEAALYGGGWGLLFRRPNCLPRHLFEKGNGLVSVLAYPASRPNKTCWPETERWLQQRYAQLIVHKEGILKYSDINGMCFASMRILVKVQRK